MYMQYGQCMAKILCGQPTCRSKPPHSAGHWILKWLSGVFISGLLANQAYLFAALEILSQNPHSTRQDEGN